MNIFLVMRISLIICLLYGLALFSSEEGGTRSTLLSDNVEPLFVQERKPQPPTKSTSQAIPCSEEEEPAVSTDCSTSENPWFIGPLLTFSSEVIEFGYIDIEPYLRFNAQTDQYDRHWHAKKIPTFYTLSPLVLVEVGFAKRLSYQVIPRASYNWTKRASSFVFNDFILILNFQLYKGDMDKAPNVKLYIQELFPTGRYQHLKASKLGTDSGGGGCFVTQAGFIIGEMHHIRCDSYFSWRLNPFYNFHASRHVSGVNTYGGAPNTRGTIRLGASWGLFFGCEYSLTKNWVLAMDAYGYYQDSVHFFGKQGTNSDGTVASVGMPSSAQFSLAPAIEYNWSESFGMIAGPWFTIAGRNSPCFVGGLIAFNYYGKLPKRKGRGPSCVKYPLANLPWVGRDLGLYSKP